MTEYAFMKALEIWYDKIDFRRLLDHFAEEKARAFSAQCRAGARAQCGRTRFRKACRARGLDAAHQG
jgi:hypothetical protein